jgi:DNA polymerase I-like protein with 3'-5' exonuclease and polymerase domains
MSTNPKLRVRIVETADESQRAFTDITSNSVVSLDTETSGLYPHTPGSWITSIGIGSEKYQWCFPLQHHTSRRKDRPKLQRAMVSRLAKSLTSCKVVAHNGKFDARWIKKIFGIKIHIDFDTMLAHYNLDENKRHDLTGLSEEYFNADSYDIPLEEKWGIKGKLERHCEYLAKDVYYTRKLYFIFQKMFRKDKLSLKVFEKLTMPVSWMYTDVEMHGVYVDSKELKKAHSYWTKKAAQALQKLNRLCPSENSWKDKHTKEMCYGVNWNSPQQVAEILFDKLKLKVLEKTPKGGRCTDESVLLRLSKRSKIPKLILEYREATKNLSTFITAWQRWCVNSRMHPSFLIHGTVTGRPSCKDPNLQQTPRDPRIRGLITAPPGWVLIDADFSQVELRILAELSRDSALLYAYQTGQDVHNQTVQEVFGIATPSKEERKKGKAINFGFMYGMWWKKFAKYALDNYGVVFTDSQAKRIRKTFFKVYKGIPPWHTKQKRYANKYGEVRNLIGRKRRLPDAMKNDNSYQCSEAERQAINSPVQSFASDMTLMAAIEIHNTISSKSCRIVGTVHDSLLIEVRKDKIMRVATKVKAIMEHPKLMNEFQVELSIPIIAEIEVGPWSKGEKIHFKKLP